MNYKCGKMNMSKGQGHLRKPEKVTWEEECIQEERHSMGAVLGISFLGKTYQRTGAAFTPECWKLSLFMELNVE